MIVEVVIPQPLTTTEINSFKGMPVGGLTGQVLSKLSGNDFDIEWIDVDGMSVDWATITGKPSTFPPTTHTHIVNDVTGLQNVLDNKQPLSSVLTSTTAAFTTTLETKLNGIAVGAEVNVNADWNAGSGDAQILNKPITFTPSAHSHVVLDVTGLQTALDDKQPLNAVLTNTTASFTSAQETKLSGMATGATANSSDAALLSRSNHTGTQLASTISDFNTAADARVTAGITGKENTITAGTTAQYWRGDKSWQTLDKASVGLGNVDNTSDTTKNSATVTLTNKTISGASNTLSNIAQSSITNLVTDLSNKQPLDSKLTSFSGLSGISTGLVKLTSGVASLDTNSYYLSSNPSGYTTNTGTVTTASVVSTNGFAGSVANAGTTPAITISTTITGLLRGNGTAVSSAVAGTDYLAPNGSGSALTGITAAQVGASATGHTHTLSNITDVTMTVANLNTLDDGVNTALHFHDTDRNRVNHTGTQLASTISDFNSAADARITLASLQPLDADLTAIAALSGTNTIYYRSAANTWSPVTIGANLTFSSGSLSASGGGGGGSVTTGVSEIDFGSGAGLTEVNLVVTGQTSITSTSVVSVQIEPSSTSNHTIEDHRYAATFIAVTTDSVVNGTGFTIRARSLYPMTGKFNIRWVWQ